MIQYCRVNEEEERDIESLDDICWEWLRAVKRGDVDEEKRLSDAIDLADWCVSCYEVEEMINSGSWKGEMQNV